MENYKLQLQNEIIMKKNILHRELFKIDNNLEFKVFLAVLTMSTMICKKNKEFKKEQTFSLKGFMSKKSFLPRNKLSKEKIGDIVNDFEMHAFFDKLVCEEETITFKISDEYRKTFKSKGFQKIDLMKLKGCRSINTTKIALLTQIQPKGYYYLNYLSVLLHLDDLDRPAKIRAIKRAFAKIEGITFAYIYPKNGETRTKDHFRFVYEPIEIEEVEELEAVEEVKIEEIEEFIEEEYTTEYFDIEPEKVEEIEKEESFEVDFDFLKTDFDFLDEKKSSAIQTN